MIVEIFLTVEFTTSVFVDYKEGELSRYLVRSNRSQEGQKND